MEKLFFITLLVLLVKVVFFDILIINQKFLKICKNIVRLFCTYDFYVFISYAIIRECLVEENDRREMTSIRAYLCHSKMLSKRAFEV